MKVSNEQKVGRVSNLQIKGDLSSWLWLDTEFEFIAA